MIVGILLVRESTAAVQDVQRNLRLAASGVVLGSRASRLLLTMALLCWLPALSGCKGEKAATQQQGGGWQAIEPPATQPKATIIPAGTAGEQ